MKDYFGKRIQIGDYILYFRDFAGAAAVTLGRVEAIAPAGGVPAKLKVRRLRENDRILGGQSYAWIIRSELCVVVPAPEVALAEGGLQCVACR